MSRNAMRYNLRRKPIPAFVLQTEDYAVCNTHKYEEAEASEYFWDMVVGSAKAGLAACGYGAAALLPDYEPVAIQLLAELVNLAAKTSSEEFYQFKPWLIRRSIELGAGGGWGEDGVFYLQTEEGGVCCFHDPFGELWRSLTPEQNALRWPHAWSRVIRQNQAYNLVLSWLGDRVVLAEMANMTSPSSPIA